jgi:hypothetical protein
LKPSAGCWPLVAGLLLAAGPALADTAWLAGDDGLEVLEEDVLVHEQPDPESPVVRRLYRGEILKARKYLETDDGRVWLEISLGEDGRGYVPANEVAPAGRFPKAIWRKSVIVRDEHPVGLALRVLGETYGVGLNLRYLAFTRLGLSLGVGPVIEEFVPRGTALTVGIVMLASTRNLSPFFDLGATRMSYHEGLTKLQITALFITVGLEWMADWGGFIAGGITYLRSMDISVTIKYDDARSGRFEAGSYGFFGEMLDGELFQAVAPSFSIGYGF